MFLYSVFVNLLPLSFLSFLDIIEKIQYNDDNQVDEEDYVKVAIVDDKAYWVFQNTLYEADIVDDDIVREEARPVNAFDMQYEQVAELMELLDELENWTE